MGNAFKRIAQGFQEAIEHSQGKTEGSRVHRLEKVDVAAIRKKPDLAASPTDPPPPAPARPPQQGKGSD